MLKNAVVLPNVSYVVFDGQQIPFPGQTFELITFAGFLCYAKSLAMRNETLRVGKPNGLIVAYDFSVELETFLKALEVQVLPTITDYNHRENFDGMPHRQLHKLDEKNWEVEI